MRTLGAAMVMAVPIGIIVAITWAGGGGWRSFLFALGIVGIGLLLALWTAIGMKLAIGG